MRPFHTFSEAVKGFRRAYWLESRRGVFHYFTGAYTPHPPGGRGVGVCVGSTEIVKGWGSKAEPDIRPRPFSPGLKGCKGSGGKAA